MLRVEDLKESSRFIRALRVCVVSDTPLRDRHCGDGFLVTPRPLCRKIKKLSATVLEDY